MKMSTLQMFPALAFNYRGAKKFPASREGPSLLSIFSVLVLQSVHIPLLLNQPDSHVYRLILVVTLTFRFFMQGDQSSQSQRKSTLNIHWKDWWWSWSFMYFGLLTQRANSLQKTRMLGKTEGSSRSGQQKMSCLDSIIDSRDSESEQTLGDGEGQGKGSNPT